MAQLTESEQRKLKHLGVYARERCDREGCLNVIGPLAWSGRSGKVYCTEACRNLQEGLTVNRRKERQKAVDPGIECQEHDRSQRVAGLEKVEAAIIERMQKEPQTRWNSTGVLDLLQEQGFGRRRDIRQAIWNLMHLGAVTREGRVLKLQKNALASVLSDLGQNTSKNANGAGKMRQIKPYSQESHGYRGSKPRIRVFDAPFEDGGAN